MLDVNGRLTDLLSSTSMIGDIVNPGVGPTVVNFFDYFFSDNLGIPDQDFNAFIQWNVTNGSVDLVGGIGPGVFGAPPAQPTGRYVDLGGSTGDPGLFETRLAFPVVAGQTYNLTFDYRSTGGDANSATASIAGQTFSVSSSNTDFQRFSQNFTATETGIYRLGFQGNEADRDNSGIGIDGVLFGQVVANANGGTPTTGTGGTTTPGAGPSTPGSSPALTDVFRFYNAENGTHFYTTSTAERDSIVSGSSALRLEGNAFDVPTPGAGAVDVFRFYNSNTGDHFYTSSAAERDRLSTSSDGYAFEGVGFQAYQDNGGGSHTELFRLYNNQTGSHFYTSDIAERDAVLVGQPQFQLEGVAFFVNVA